MTIPPGMEGGEPGVEVGGLPPQAGIFTLPGLAGGSAATTTPVPIVPAGAARELGEILAILTTVNATREQLIRLGLNPSLNLAINIEIIPVLNILSILATSTANYAAAAQNLNSISVAKVHDVKKLLELVYDIADLSEDVLEVLTKLTLATLPKAPPQR